jgi:phage-related protein
MKRVVFLGSSLTDLRAFPSGPRQAAGFQLDRLQHGLVPNDWKPMPSIGAGAAELRVRSAEGAFRVIYVAKLADGLYVLHAFRKATQKTPAHDIELARARYALIWTETGL